MTLRTGAAPSLPMEFSQAINGVKVGSSAGSCGTVAYRKELVVASDIATDSLWSAGRQLALRHGLRACWSTPILVPGGAVAGTFAIYYREPCAPTAQHLEIIAHATHLAGIAIEHERAQTQLRAVRTVIAR